jgi:hypothetical protein
LGKGIQNPEGVEAGYVYDFVRQQQNRQIEQIEKCKKLKKKMDKLSRKNRYAKMKR